LLHLEITLSAGTKNRAAIEFAAKNRFQGASFGINLAKKF